MQLAATGGVDFRVMRARKVIETQWLQSHVAYGQQFALASAIKLSQGRVSRAITGAMPLPAKHAAAVATFVGVTADAVTIVEMASRGDVQPQERQRPALSLAAGVTPSGSSTTPTPDRHPAGTFTEASKMDLEWYAKSTLRGNEDLLREWLAGAMALADQIAKRTEGLSREVKARDP